MNRLTSLVIAASLALGIGAVGARAQQAPKVEVQALRGSLHLLQGGGGNVVASVGFDGILLIDDDYPQYAPAYEEAIAKLAGAGLAPGFVVNTHWHGDHTGNNEYWGNRGAIIFGHNNVRKRMSSGQRIEALDMQVEPSPAMALTPSVPIPSAIAVVDQVFIPSSGAHGAVNWTDDARLYSVAQSVTGERWRLLSQTEPNISTSTATGIRTGCVVQPQPPVSPTASAAPIPPGGGSAEVAPVSSDSSSTSSSSLSSS